MSEIRDQAERAAHKAQVTGDRLLEQHDVQAAILDGGAQTTLGLGTAKHLVNRVGVTGKRQGERANILCRLLTEATERLVDLFKLMTKFGTSNH